MTAPMASGDEPATTFADKLSFMKSGGLLDVNGDQQNLHVQWHLFDAFPGPHTYALLGKDFLEFHREYLAQYDDFALSRAAVDAPMVKFQAAIPFVPGGKTGPDGMAIAPTAKLYGMVRPGAVSLNGFTRKPFQNIYDNTDLNGTQIQKVAKSATFTIGNATFDALIVDDLGNAIDNTTGPTDVPHKIKLPTTAGMPGAPLTPELDLSLHALVHVSVASHDLMVMDHGDHGVPKYNVKDVSFYHWHKFLDNIYSDWAVAQYRSGTPAFFSVDVGSTGAASTTLAARSAGDVYFAGSNKKPDGTALAQASTFGARPRVASDIYVADNKDTNELFAYGLRRWSDPVHMANPAGGNANDPANPPVFVTQDATKFWNIDAYSDMNPQLGDGVYFSVSKDSMGKAGSTVRGEAPNLGADVFKSPSDGTNSLYRAESKLGLRGTDELDALEIDFSKIIQAGNDEEKLEIHDRDRQYFSLKTNSINGQQAYVDATNVREARGGDILNFGPDGRLIIAVPFDKLALAAGDELDALFILDVNKSNKLDNFDKIYFSLDRASPSLGGDSPADLFLHTLGQKNAGKQRALTADDLGLLAADNLDGLDHFVQAKKKDYGDISDSYGTLEFSNGPRYDEGALQHLGLAWDKEIDGQPTDDGLGDNISQLGGDPTAADDDDGVLFGSSDVSLTVASNRAGIASYRLRGWFDMDANGAFEHTSELLVDSLLELAPGAHALSFPLSFDPQLKFSRFRLDWLDDPLGTSGGLSLATNILPVGEFLAADGFSHGEVEDYAPIPEPATAALCGVVVGVAAARRSGRRRAGR